MVKKTEVSQADPATLYEEFPEQLLGERVVSCWWILSTVGMLSEAQKESIRKKITRWLKQHNMKPEDAGLW